MKRHTVVGILIFSLALAPMVLREYWINLCSQALLYATVAAGLVLLVGKTGLPSLGHGVFFGLGGYGTAMAITRLGMNPWGALVSGVLLSVAVAACFAPLAARTKNIGFLTITLAFGQVIWGLATRGGEFTGGENGITGVMRPSSGLGFWDLREATGFYYLTLAFAAMIMLALSRFSSSPVGLSLVALRDSPSRMMSMGYNVHMRKTMVFIISASVAAMSGTLSAIYNGYVGPSALDWRLSAQLMLAVVVGGAHSIWGAFLSGAGLHVLKIYLTGFTERWPMVLGLIYVIVVVILPEGLTSFGSQVKRIKFVFLDRGCL